MLDKFKTLLSNNKDVKEEEFEASQLAVASLMVTTALHDGEFDEIEKNEILKLLGNFYNFDNDKLNKFFEASYDLVDNANDIHQFTSKINSLLTDDEKIMMTMTKMNMIMMDNNDSKHVHKNNYSLPQHHYRHIKKCFGSNFDHNK